MLLQKTQGMDTAKDDVQNCPKENEEIGIGGMLSDVINILNAGNQDYDVHLLHLVEDDND